MLFTQISRFEKPPAEPRTAYLRNDNWDDFTFKTLFHLIVVDRSGTLHEIGAVKIMEKGMTSGRVALPNVFESLSDNFCSLGQDQNYYETLVALPNDIGDEVLKALRDCAANPEIWRSFRNESAMGTSLLRTVDTRQVEVTFRNIVEGNAELTPFHFGLVARPSSGDGPPLSIDVHVEPDSMPPTNIHVLVGRNGVGKTRLLAGIADALTSATPEGASRMGWNVEFIGEATDSRSFANLVTIAFSAFDYFEPIPTDSISGNIRYGYIGIKREAGSSEARAATRLKSLRDVQDEFIQSLKVCLTGPRRRRWLETIDLLNSDPGFADIELREFASTGEMDSEQIAHTFDILSSGHKIVLLTATRLVELVDERTLVLFDEPESHLHPPLLSSLVRAISKLLVHRNGIALIATHSPVVLQEVPASCVSIIRRSGSHVVAERPSIETFGENVGTLTYEVFQLEVTESGFHKMITDAVDANGYEQALHRFGGQLGGEGRAIARAIAIQKRGRTG